MSKRVIFLFGPPGSGKGTQASLLAHILNIPIVATGNLLRRECDSGTTLGNAAAASLRDGALVPDPLMNQLVALHLSRPECQDGFVLDGYPRTAAQADYLDGLLDSLRLPRPEVVVIDVDAAHLIERLTVRQECPACGRSYNDRHWAPAHRGFCDDEGMPLVRRRDDVEPVIRQRLRLYETTSQAVLARYPAGAVHRVDGRAAPGLVLEAIESALALYATRP